MLPTTNPTVTFQIWDKDLVGSDDYISAVTMDFSSQAREAFENDISVKILGKESVGTSSLGNVGGKITGLIGGNDEEKKAESKAAPKKETKMTEGEKFCLDLMNVAKEGTVI